MKYQILKAQEKHFKDITEIYNYYIENSTATYYTHTLSVKEMKKKGFCGNKKYGSFVIINKNEVVGYCILGQYNKKEGYDRTAEISIYLKPQHTKQNLGKIAVDFIEQIAIDRKIHCLIAAISAKNIASQKLFEKCGFKKCAHFKEVGYKFGEVLDDVYFQKILN